ncbi:MAG: LPS assembly lipoprotein LptE [Verrucomicrobiota bacterium]
MHFARWLPLWLVALGLTGCAGYKLGSTNGVTAGARSAQIMPFSNQTMEPRLGEVVTSQLRREMQRDGTYQLASHDDGDIIVSGVVVNYLRLPLSFQPTDALTVTDYSVKLVAQVTARERSTGKVVFNERVTGSTLIIVGSDLTSAERQALPLLAADFAKNATARLVQGSW